MSKPNKNTERCTSKSDRSNRDMPSRGAVSLQDQRSKCACRENPPFRISACQNHRVRIPRGQTLAKPSKVGPGLCRENATANLPAETVENAETGLLALNSAKIPLPDVEKFPVVWCETVAVLEGDPHESLEAVREEPT